MSKEVQFKMEREKGYKYLLEGSSNLDEFAMGVLTLVNLQSNDMGILKIQTFQDSERVLVITNHENDSYMESYVGKVLMKEEIDIYIAGVDHLEIACKRSFDGIRSRLKESDFEFDYYIHYHEG